MKTFGTTKYVYLVALLIAIPRAGESKVVDSRDQEVEQFVVSCVFLIPTNFPLQSEKKDNLNVDGKSICKFL